MWWKSHLHKVLGLIVFFRTHPNLLFLCYKGKTFQAITGNCRLATPINFIRGISAVGNWTPLETFMFPLVLFSCRCHARRIRLSGIHKLSVIITDCYYQDSHVIFLFFPSSAVIGLGCLIQSTWDHESSMQSGQSKGEFFFPITLYTVCHWKELYDYLVICPKINIKICQVLCKNCFHRENRKLHAMAWWSFWCMGVVKIRNGVDVTVEAFACLMNNKIWEFCWYAWLIPIWLKEFVSKDTVICITMLGNRSD